MKFLILAAGLSAALGFTYSAFTAGRYTPPQFDASCLKVSCVFAVVYFIE